MNMVLNYLQYLGYILIFPGFLFCFVAGLLLCGIDRKLVARMQKRVGPPVLQPFYDFFKLCGKETIIPTAASKTTFLAAPIVGFAALVVIQLFIPIRGFTPFAVLGDIADVIVILYLLLIPAIATIMGGAASGLALCWRRPQPRDGHDHLLRASARSGAARHRQDCRRCDGNRAHVLHDEDRGVPDT